MHHSFLRGLPVELRYAVPILVASLALAAPARASLSGSYLQYDCGDCYVEGATQTLCFDAHSVTDDGEQAESVWLEFPDTWTVTSVYEAGPQVCTDPSATWGSFSWSLHGGNPWEVRIDHPRYHGYLDHCSTTYCVTVDAGLPSGAEHVSWYWADTSGQGYPPHYVGSDDGYTPTGWTVAQEDTTPPAYVPHCDPRVLLIQDDLPWGVDAWQTELTGMGLFYDEIYSSDIAYTDIGEYDLVITSGDQDGTYHANINNALTDIEDYLDQGGRLIFSAATDAAETPYLDVPFAGTFFQADDAHDSLAEPDHPLAAELGNPIGPNYFTSTGYYAYLPGEATVITNQLASGLPSLYELRVGQGVMIVSTQALEEAWGSGWDLESVLPLSIDYLMGFGVWDVDGDGYGDCHDNCADDYNPFQEDLDGDGVGDDCDTCTDADGDGWGNAISDTSGCPAGATADCIDDDADVNPGQSEWYDGKDNDCDGLYDETVLPGNAVVITEVMKDPGVVGDTVGEWFEVYNNTGYAMNLVGLDVSDSGTNAFSVDVDVWIDAYGYAVFARNGDPLVNGGVAARFVYTNFQLSNDVDQIILQHAGVELDRIEYDDGVTWPDPDGASMSLDLGAYDISLNNDGDNWCTSRHTFGAGDLGTPNLENPVCCEDLDGDGYYDAACTGDDCDDTNPAVNPAETEVCDLLDNNCDGSVDEGFDVDGDGYSSCDGDCDDADAAINPDATEQCDGVDHDCDGDVSAENADGCTTYYLDNDDDNYGVTGTGVCLCSGADPYDAPFDGDCDDAEPLANPGAAEVCDDLDNNCDGAVDEGFDVDGDGYTTCQGDCDDWDATANPAGIEVCDFADNDCDGDVDEDATDAPTYYADQDGDGYGSNFDPQVACQGPPGYVADSTDCDDGNPLVNPGALEVCNGGVDDDCNGATDENSDSDGDGYTVCSGDCDDTDSGLNPTDGDGDGVSSCDGDCNDGDPNLSTHDLDGDGYSTCAGDCNDGDAALDPSDSDGDGYSTCSGDCNDANASMAPGLLEECDGLDNDCDATSDENVDDDLDGYTECDDDCNDEDDSVYPGALELCDGLDNDCDAGTDEYTDDDGDGMTECQGDCDDTDAAVYLGALEDCDGLDNDCDGVVPGVETDVDQDGYLACLDDCDDFEALTYPGAPEQCDGRDNDCDLDVDEDVTTDDDGDGWTECEDDCDDTDPATYPGAYEDCDGADNDCNGQLGPLEYDGDGDGWMACEGDCNDNDADLNPADEDGDGWSSCDQDCDDSEAAVHPGHDEICDGLDNDCNGVPGSGENDADGDGVMLCEGDCDDADATVFPDAEELCDDLDNDCDGDIDEDDACAGDDDSAEPADDDDDGGGEPVGDCECRAGAVGAAWSSPGLLVLLAGLIALRRRP